MINPSVWAYALPPMLVVQNNTSDTAYLLSKNGESLAILTLFPLSYNYAGNPLVLEMSYFGELRQLIIHFDDPPQIYQSSQDLLSQLPKSKQANTCYWYDYREGQFHYIGTSKAVQSKFDTVVVSDHKYGFVDHNVVDCGKAPKNKARSKLSTGE